MMFADGLLKGQKILVTGGGTGLGRSMAEAFLELGAEVVIWGRRGPVLEQAAAEMRDATGGTVASTTRVPSASVSRAAVSAASSTTKRRAGSSLPRFHAVWNALARSCR